MECLWGMSLGDEPGVDIAAAGPVPAATVAIPALLVAGAAAGSGSIWDPVLGSQNLS